MTSPNPVTENSSTSSTVGMATAKKVSAWSLERMRVTTSTTGSNPCGATGSICALTPGCSMSGDEWSRALADAPDAPSSMVPAHERRLCVVRQNDRTSQHLFEGL